MLVPMYVMLPIHEYPTRPVPLSLSLSLSLSLLLGVPFCSSLFSQPDAAFKLKAGRAHVSYFLNLLLSCCCLDLAETRLDATRLNAEPLIYTKLKSKHVIRIFVIRISFTCKLTQTA